MKRLLLTVMAALSLFVLSGCLASEGEEDSQYRAYYLNKEKTKIVEEAYSPKAAIQKS